MKRLLLALSLLAAPAAPFVAIPSPSARAVESFEEAWAKRWGPRVSGSLLSRRFEPQIKASAREVWDVAQANAVAKPPKPAGPLVVKPKTSAKAKAQASAAVRTPGRSFQRSRFFRRRK